MDSAPRWFFNDAGTRRGPYDLPGLITRLLDYEQPEEVWVWRDGLPEWKKAGQIPETASQLPPPLPKPDMPDKIMQSPAPPAKSVTSVSSPPQQQSPSPHRTPPAPIVPAGRREALAVIVILVLIFGLAALLSRRSTSTPSTSPQTERSEVTASTTIAIPTPYPAWEYCTPDPPPVTSADWFQYGTKCFHVGSYEAGRYAYDNALSEARRLIALRPDDVAAHYWAALTLKSLGRLTEAKEEAEKAARLERSEVTAELVRSIDDEIQGLSRSRTGAAPQ